MKKRVIKLQAGLILANNLKINHLVSVMTSIFSIKNKQNKFLWLIKVELSTYSMK
jgi:hypothetical protein